MSIAAAAKAHMSELNNLVETSSSTNEGRQGEPAPVSF